MVQKTQINCKADSLGKTQNHSSEINFMKKYISTSYLIYTIC